MSNVYDLLIDGAKDGAIARHGVVPAWLASVLSTREA